MQKYIFLLISIFLVLSTSNLSAQTLKGKVIDAVSKDGLPGANIVVKSREVSTGAASLTNGDFEIKELPTGEYEIIVSFIGYATETIKDFVIEQDEIRTLNIALKQTGVLFSPVSISASRRPEKTLEAPAAISILEAREISQYVTPSSAEALKNVTGVDMATTGIDRREIVLRGFGNAFSGATYILTDYRKAAVPSLDVNLHSIMPNMAVDLSRVEVVRGPGSALYGAGVDAGVIHYLTKDPFTHPGTAVSFTGGQRSTFAGSFRHANSFNDKFGYKITGQYAQADDWQLNSRDSIDTIELNKDALGTTRNYDYQKMNINGLLQYRLGQKTILTANSGFSALDASVLSAIGTVQADDFGYSYGQLRLQSGRFFAQAYLNKNNAGDSFIYGTGDKVVDKSTLFNLQAQYDLEFSDGKQQLVFGLDYDRTTPDTDSTIFGRNENNDLISEFGIYGQSLTKLSPKFDLTLALRADKNNIEDGLQLSPRAALVFKANAFHTFRATYNRAYSLPGANSLFLDIIGAEIPLTDEFSIIQRGRGSINGLTFSSATAGGVIRASGLLPIPTIFGQELIYSGINQPTPNIAAADVYSAIFTQLNQIDPEQIQLLLAANGVELEAQNVQFFLSILNPQNLDIQGQMNTEIEFAPVDIEPLKSTITHSMEMGYKGLIRNKILFAVDAYYTKKKNFVSGNTLVTPRALYSNFEGEFIPELAAALQQFSDDNLLIASLLSNVNLTPAELAGFITQIAVAGGIKDIGVGVVQTDQSTVPGELIGGYRNFGDVDFWGLDASFQYLASDRLNLFGNISFVSDDLFDDDELNEPGTGLQVALNATSLKWKSGFSYDIPKSYSINSSVRFIRGFPVRSGTYVGDVEDYFLWDIGAGYDFSGFVSGMRFDFTLQNVLNNEHREFIGAPQIGRLALARLSYTLP